MSESGRNRPLVVVNVGINDGPRAMLAEHADVEIVAAYDADSLRAAVKEAEGLIVRVPLPADIFDHAPKMRAVARHGVGLDMIPVEAATARGIPVTNVPHANAGSVAEYAFAGLLEFNRRTRHIHGTLLDSRDWAKARAIGEGTTEIGSINLGVVGYGNIGRRVVAIGQGFGMTVRVSLRTPKDLPPGVEACGLDDLFRESDAIVLCCPSTPETKGLVSAERLAMARPSLILVNPSRGAVVDGDALLAALRDGRIRGAVLDTHEPTPLPQDSPLFDLPNVLLTPHLAGITQDSMERSGQVAVADMIRMLAGERPEFLCNPEIHA